MLKSRNFFLVFFLLSLTLTGFLDADAQVVEKNIYYNEEVEFSFTKPAEWHFLSFDEILKEKGTTVIDESKEDATKRKQYLKNLPATTGMEPVAISRFKEPYNGLNPQFQAFLHSGYDVYKDTALSLLNQHMYYSSQKITGFRIIVPPTTVMVSGHKAAYSRFYLTYTTNEGENIKAKSMIFLIPKEDKYFVLSITSSKDDWSSLVGDYKQIIRSINVKYKK